MDDTNLEVTKDANRKAHAKVCRNTVAYNQPMIGMASSMSPMLHISSCSSISNRGEGDGEAVESPLECTVEACVNFDDVFALVLASPSPPLLPLLLLESPLMSRNSNTRNVRSGHSQNRRLRRFIIPSTIARPCVPSLFSRTFT